jgi:Uma2 family endonuclease
MADNTRQARWIFVLFGNLCALFRDLADVFVAADLFWYAVEGDPGAVQAPDVMAVFGRPKGDRGSYRQWEENNVPVTVAFEILSPNNTPEEMADKFDFYTEHGVEEYYLFNPDTNSLRIWLRQGTALLRARPAHGFVSPRLGIRFDLSGPGMVVYRPDGQRFLSFEELEAERERERQRADRAEKDAQDARQQLAHLAELSRKARLNQASAEELQELERLEGESSAPA